MLLGSTGALANGMIHFEYGYFILNKILLRFEGAMFPLFVFVWTDIIDQISNFESSCLGKLINWFK